MDVVNHNCNRLGLLVSVTVLTTFIFSATGTSITEEPTSVNAALNSFVKFSCSTTGVSMLWLMNGVPVQSAIQEGDITIDISHITGSGIEGTLTILASEEYNNTEIVCRVENTDLTDELTQPVTLIVQGLLAPPGALKVMNTNNGDIILSWTPPYTLDITEVDPDISNYTVYIINTNTGNTGTVSVTELDGNGVVETEYTFTGLPGEDPDPCHVYQFSVSAWNVVGEGERGGPVERWFLGAPMSITDLTIEMSLRSAKQPEITSSLKVDMSKTCPGRVPAILRYRVNTTDTEQNFTHPMSRIKPDGSLECSISDNVKIDANSEYSVEVTAENEVEKSLPIFGNFSTFDVQTTVILTTSDTIVVTCFFAEDSQAKGCRVDFLSQEGNTCNMTIDKGSGPQANGRFELPDGKYEILVYDIEADGSLSENPAYEHDEIVIIQGSSVSECKVSYDTEDDSEDEKSDSGGGNTNSISMHIIVVGSLGAVLCVVLVTFLIACISLLICKRKRKKVETAEENRYEPSLCKPTSEPDGRPSPLVFPLAATNRFRQESNSSDDSTTDSSSPLVKEPYPSFTETQIYQNSTMLANPDQDSKPPSEPDGGPPPALPLTVPSHYQNSKKLADLPHGQPASAHYLQIDLTHSLHHRIPCHGTSDVTYSQVACTETAPYPDSPRVGKRHQHPGTNKTGVHFH